MSKYTFGKPEKLCSKLMIEDLFRSGKSFKQYPIRVIYKKVERGDATAKLLITVPKKRFGKAVSRNKVKRLVREAYRLTKPDLIEKWHNEGKYFALAFVYIGNEIPEFDETKRTMQQIIEQLNTINEWKKYGQY